MKVADEMYLEKRKGEAIIDAADEDEDEEEADDKYEESEESGT